MVRCSHCNTENFDGTIFCLECGASLLSTAQRRETTASLNKAGSDSLSNVEELAPITIPAPSMVERAVAFVVINSGRRIRLNANEELLVGRKDNQRGIYPDVDLGLDGGYDAGVSRRHAILAPQAAGFALEDLNSANGTFVNGRRLEPQTPTLISHGDEVKFGTLILRFEVG